MTPEFYLSLVTMHGTIMVFFVLTTAPQGGFGNYFLPIQIGADDMAFPVLNMMSFWVTCVGFIVILAAIFFSGSPSTVGPIGGWTGYAPLSALGQIAGPGQGMGMNLWIISIAIFCVGSLLGALNFITTLLNMRTRGMSLMRMPLTAGRGLRLPFWRCFRFRCCSVAASCCCLTALPAQASSSLAVCM